MRDETTRERDANELDRLDHVVLHLLLDDGTAGIWSEREVAQAIGSDVGAAHSLVALHAAGLIHRLEEFVFASRAAARFNQLEEAP